MIEEIEGKILKKIEISDNNMEIIFITNDNEKYIMYHNQNCCENVMIDEIIGDIDDLINTPILLAEERTNSKDKLGKQDLNGSFTWTFYELKTIKGSVTIRWLGKSNGFYSESVNFEKIN